MSAPREKHVFISVGSRFTAAQEAFLEALLKMLEGCGVTPRVMNKTRQDFPTGNPLVSILRVMGECHGAVIVAFERKFIAEGLERRDSPEQTQFRNITLTTPWNQIEASMAFTRGIPILVLAEHGLHEEGLLEQKYDWYVQRLAIDPVALSSEETRRRIQIWCERLPTEPAKDEGRPITADWTIADFLRRLTIKTTVQILVVLSVVFGAGVSVGKWLPVGATATTSRSP